MCRQTHIRSVTPGRLRGRFLLPSHRAEICLNPSESTIFRLFLAHPEGIASDNLLSYWKELGCIYAQESLFDNPSRQTDVIEAICSESKRCFYPIVSRIKRKFVNTIGARKAAGYYIKRCSDGLYRTKAVLVY